MSNDAYTSPAATPAVTNADFKTTSPAPASPVQVPNDANHDGADDDAKPYGDPNAAGSTVHFPNATKVEPSAEDKYYGEQNAAHGSFKIVVNNIGKEKSFTYATKEEQQEAAQWFTALFPGQTPQRTTTDGGATVVITTV